MSYNAFHPTQRPSDFSDWGRPAAAVAPDHRGPERRRANTAGVVIGTAGVAAAVGLVAGFAVGWRTALDWL